MAALEESQRLELDQLIDEVAAADETSGHALLATHDDVLFRSGKSYEQRATIRTDLAHELSRRKLSDFAVAVQARFVADARASGIGQEDLFNLVWVLAKFMVDAGRAEDAVHTVIDAISLARASSLEGRHWRMKVASLLGRGGGGDELHLELVREWAQLELERLGEEEFFPCLAYVWLARALVRAGEFHAAFKAYQTAEYLARRPPEQREELTVILAEQDELARKSADA